MLVKNVYLPGRQKLAYLLEYCFNMKKCKPVTAIPVFEVLNEMTLGSKPQIIH